MSEPYRFDLVTLFGPLCEPYLRGSILGRAWTRGLIDVGFTDPRDFTTDPHRTVDDAPFGGGAGMVMLPEPLALAIEDVRARRKPARTLLLSPSGRPLTQAIVRELAALGSLCLVCGRYEGVDQRISDHVVDDEISVGDYVLTGGELGAMVIVDAVSRLLPDVLGNAEGPESESFSDHALLEYPQYTRPQVWREHAIPEVLFSGHHGKIAAWRLAERMTRTQARRPDLWADYVARHPEVLAPPKTRRIRRAPSRVSPPAAPAADGSTRPPPSTDPDGGPA
ncbi:MAG: tRNA (guanosine(37)-N1)-methyltransferase TrmD [Deltaproteobacteria bacterium]|nr:tRNA (guanosine(37)-N1)-methyltransferase TrmD [Deltaproteobacteria bacterium]